MTKRKHHIVLATLSAFLLVATRSGCKPQPDRAEKIMGVYQNILRNETAFSEVGRYGHSFDDSMQKERSHLDEFFTKLYVESGVVNPKYELEFSVVDVDGDKMPEVIVNERPCYNKLILRYEKGIVYACLLGDKEFGEIKTDGTAYWESGVDYIGFCRLEFTGETFGIVVIAERDTGADPSWAEYYLDGVRVSEEAFLGFQDAQWTKEDVTWYNLTDENIKMYVR